MTNLLFDDIPLSQATTRKSSHRYRRAQFGDGYSQVVTDGVNAVKETWDLVTVPLTNDEWSSLESYLLSRKGQVINWAQPYKSRSFSRTVSSQKIELGFQEVESVALNDLSVNAPYASGAFALNNRTGLVTIQNSSVIPDGTTVGIDLVLLDGNYVIDDGWKVSIVSGNFVQLSLVLERVYV
jgi:phage-related protein